MKNIIAYLILLLSVVFLNVYAASDAASELIQQDASGINYVNGGVGEEQRKELKELRKKFNLQITFSEKHSGAFLADSDVIIRDNSGNEVFELSNAGPLLLVRLKPGNYRIKATSGDKTQTKTIHINRRGIRDLYFYW